MAFNLAILSTHPIQYYAPVFQLLAKESTINLKVFYSLGAPDKELIDKGFGKKIKWDIPLLDGYQYEFLENTAVNKGSHHFSGIKNPAIIAKINEFKPDALLVYGWAYDSHLKAIRHFYKKIPIWFRGDSTLLNRQSKLKTLMRRLFLKWVYHHIDKAFYVGEQNKAYYKAYGLKESQLKFAPHAIDNSRFGEDRTAEALKIRADIGLQESDILILFAGKLEEVKNPHLLLAAFQKINQKNIHLLFVGNGVLEENLKVNATSDEQNTVNNRVHFLGFQNQRQMPVIYQACNLFCLPSTSETWGLSINEAMAAGKAILASDQVGCATDLVKPNVNGLIFKSNSLTDLTHTLTTLVKNKTKLDELGTQSKEIIQHWAFRLQVESIKNELI